MITMPGYEFIEKVLDGERDFQKIDLLRVNLNAHDGYEEMQNYLKEHDLEDEPIILSDSRLSFVEARGLYVPHIIAEKTQFRKANLNGAVFACAYLRGAKFGNTNLRHFDASYADLSGAYLRWAQANGAMFYYADLSDADCRDMYAGRADFSYANVTGANFKDAVLANSIREGIHGLLTHMAPHRMTLDARL